MPDFDPLLREAPQDQKVVIYQLLVRLFGNQKNANIPFGTIQQNGCGKFADINNRVLQALKALGATHIYYTGVLEHASVTHYAGHAAGDDADVVKGRAGSPFAIRDYYDVSTDLAQRPQNRLQEFEALLGRTHRQGLKAIIDFVPNHTARYYHSDQKPPGQEDFGSRDYISMNFHPQNNYYYLPHQQFNVPSDYSALGNLNHPTKDGQIFFEYPAKVSGNGALTNQPSKEDWFDTVKLNYGMDIFEGQDASFDPLPDTWLKMRQVLLYWAHLGVDGFRCDMAELVPLAFWEWVIPEVRRQYPETLFIGEVYETQQHRDFIERAGFDYLYDKSAFYDTLRPVITNKGSADQLPQAWKSLEGINHRMLRFLENHDEERLASGKFSANAFTGVPAMTVAATLGTGPLMLYFGQELGENAPHAEGFSGYDGKTTIFDYWSLETLNDWRNGGRYDGDLLEPWQIKLREFYRRLLNLCQEAEALRQGGLYDLHYANNAFQSAHYHGDRLYSFLRFSHHQRLLVVANFAYQESFDCFLKIPEEAWQAMHLPLEANYKMEDLLFNAQTLYFHGTEAAKNEGPESGIQLHLPYLSARVFQITEVG